MLRITQELRHFESIFLEPTPQPSTFRARVFDLFEELPFAGHPIIGTASVLHHLEGSTDGHTWSIDLPGKTVSITTERVGAGYYALLDQGAPEFIARVPTSQYDRFARAFNLDVQDLRRDLPLEVISTGLRYLTVAPGAIERARIPADISRQLQTVNAQFAVLLDPTTCEIRHWNNDGIIEDVATGSAAGTVGAYCLSHCQERV